MSIGYNDVVLYCSTIVIPWSWPMKENTKWKLLNFEFNIRTNILCAFHSSNFFKKERKLSKTPQTSFLMLEAKYINSSGTPKSSSIRVWQDGAFLGFSFNFKLMEMVEWKASLNNQCPLDWFRTQTITIEKRLSTINWQIC